MTTSMTFTIPMPQPGEVAAHKLGPDLTMLVENSAAIAVEDPATSDFAPYITYEPVDVRGGTRVHAAAVTHSRQRSRVSRWPLCSMTKSLRVTRRRRGEDLDTVTCCRCRRRLEKAGVLAPQLRPAGTGQPCH